MKVYSAIMLLSFPVQTPRGTVRRVTFEASGDGAIYLSNDKEEQQGIEASDYFKRKVITLVSSDDSDATDTNEAKKRKRRKK